MKWTSKAAKPLIKRIHEALLSGDWGNIFSPGFDVEEFDFKAMRESDDDWTKAFSQKQFQSNTKNMILRLIEEHGRADFEANDLGGGGVGGGGGGGVFDDVPDLQEPGIDDDDDDEDDDPRIVVLPHNMAIYDDLLNSDKYATVVVQVGNGPVYTSLDGRDCKVSQGADQTLWNVEEFMLANPHFNSVAGGPFISAFAASGRRFVQDEQDWQYPDRVRLTTIFRIPFDIEQNFVSTGNIPGIYRWTSADGNNFLRLNMRAIRENHHRENANVGDMGAAPPRRPQPPSGGFGGGGFQQQQQQPNFGGFAQQPNNFGGPPTPQSSNTHGYQQQQQQQQQQQPPQAQYQSPPVQPPQYQSPPVQPPQYQSPPVQPPHYQSPPVQQTHYQSPPFQQTQYTSPPVQQTYHSAARPPPYTSPPAQVHRMHTRSHQGPDPNLPTPGVPKAAGYPKNMSVDSEFTEETVPETTTTATPTKKPGFFKRVGGIMTGNSDSDQSAHMKPSPRKYYGETPTVETVSSGSL